MAAAAGVAAAGHPGGEGAGQGEADAGEAGGDLGGDAVGAGVLGRGGRHGVIVAAGVPHLTHSIKYKCCMLSADAADHVARWQPSSVPPQAAAFARHVAERAGPGTRARRTRCCGRRHGWPRSASRSGWNPVPEVLLHPSVIERFAVSAPGLSGSGAGRCGPTCGSWPGRWCPHWPRRTRRCPVSVRRCRTARRRSPGTWRWPMPSPPPRGGCARPGWSAPRRKVEHDPRLAAVTRVTRYHRTRCVIRLRLRNPRKCFLIIESHAMLAHLIKRMVRHITCTVSLITGTRSRMEQLALESHTTHCKV